MAKDGKGSWLVVASWFVSTSLPWHRLLFAARMRVVRMPWYLFQTFEAHPLHEGPRFKRKCERRTGFVREEKYIATGRVSPDAAARKEPPSPSNETARRAHWQARKKALREAQGEKQGTDSEKASSSTCGAVALVPARWPWEHQPPHGPRTTPCTGSSKDTQTQLGSWGGGFSLFFGPVPSSLPLWTWRCQVYRPP